VVCIVGKYDYFGVIAENYAYVRHIASDNNRDIGYIHLIFNSPGKIYS